MKAFWKGVLRSKTMWFATLLSVLVWLQNHSEVVNAFVPDVGEEFAMYLIAAAVAGLRIITKKPLEDK